MSRAEYQRAERCFALARSTTFEGERNAAVAKGTTIAERAGLSLDLFDIPGRERKARPIPDRLFEGSGIFGDNFRYATIDATAFAEALQRMADGMARAQEMADERRRRSTYAHQAGLDAAVRFLADSGVNVCQSEGRFLLSSNGRLTVLTAHDVVAMARRAGWKG